MLQHYDEVQAVMLPTLGEERAQTYSPFLPICPRPGRVLQVPVVKTRCRGRHHRLSRRGRHADRDAGHRRATQAAMEGRLGRRAGSRSASTTRCTARISSRRPSSAPRSCRILGGQPPEGFNYELFLDEKGQKISKSKGNGLIVEEWLRYGPPESLALSCSSSRGAPSGSISTSSRAPSTIISAASRSCRPRSRQGAGESGLAHP